jgi:hypothetical protein
MSFGLSPNCGARSAKVFSGNGWSILVTLISPLLAVLLSEYLHTHEKHPTTFLTPVQHTDARRHECQRPELRPEPQMAKVSPRGHVELWQAFAPRPEKQALAKKLLIRASGATDDPANQFVMLRLARDVAAQANDGPTAFQAIDAMAETFHVSSDAMKLAVLTRFASAAQKPTQHKSIARQALTLADQAVGQDHFVVAHQLGKLAVAEAKRALDEELLAQAQGRIAAVAERVRAK